LIYATSKDTALLIQAIKALGKGNITEDYKVKIRKRYDGYKIEEVLNESKHSTTWIYDSIRKVFEG
jgi:Mor family transcriptional regulator